MRKATAVAHLCHLLQVERDTIQHLVATMAARGLLDHLRSGTEVEVGRHHDAPAALDFGQSV